MPIFCEYLDTYGHVNHAQYIKSCIISQGHFQWDFLILEITEFNILWPSMLFSPLNEIQSSSISNSSVAFGCSGDS